MFELTHIIRNNNMLGKIVPDFSWRKKGVHIRIYSNLILWPLVLCNVGIGVRNGFAGISTSYLLYYGFLFISASCRCKPIKICEHLWAYNLILDDMLFCKWFMEQRNKSWARTVSCRTPEVTAVKLLCWPSTTTHWDLCNTVFNPVK